MNFEVIGGFDTAIFFDKADFNLHTHRSIGRALIGQRAMQRNRPANQAQNMSLLVAMSADGILMNYCILSGWKGNYFVVFLQEFLFPKIVGQNHLLVLDNAK